MPKQRTSPTADEELSNAAIAFMKGGPISTQDDAAEAAPDRSDSRMSSAPVVEGPAQSVSGEKRSRKNRRRRNTESRGATRSEIEPPRRPFSTRIRTDLYVQLKEASLTRELQRKTPHHMSEIVEQAIEAWLASAET